MLFGVCGGVEMGQIAAKLGYDFFELSVPGYMKPLEKEEAFQAELAKVKAVGIPCLACNCFIPGDHKITGPAVDFSKLTAYVKTACRRAGEAGVKRIVFGSGGARQIPEGFSRETAWKQLGDFLRMVGPEAQKAGVVIVIEPLNTAECNVLTTVGESAKLAREVNHPNIKLLVDAYHWLKDNDSAADLAAGGDLLRHAHIATMPHRMAPGAEPTDFSEFFGILKRAGYQEGVSIEGKIDEPEAWLARALPILKAAAK